MYENSVSENYLYWSAVEKSDIENKESLVAIEPTGLYRESIGGFAEISIGENANGDKFVLQWDECKPNRELVAKIKRLQAAKSKGRCNTGLYRLENSEYVEIME